MQVSNRDRQKANGFAAGSPQGRTRLNVLAKKKHILIVGVGGLGVPAAYSLARAGAAGLALNLTLLDPDVVEVSNLPRQVIFGETDLGVPKVIAAAERLSAIFPGTRPDSRAAFASRN